MIEYILKKMKNTFIQVLIFIYEHTILELGKFNKIKGSRMRRKIVRVGASLCILLPKEIVREMEWDFGQEIDLILDEEDDKVILRNLHEQAEPAPSYLVEFDQFLAQYGGAFEELEKRVEV